jgi:hypothetical protein
MIRLVRLWRRPETALFALMLGVYCYFYQAGGWNQNSRFDLTRALVEDHSIVIDRFANNTGDTARSDHFFCDKAPGLSIAGAVPYELVHVLFGSERPSPEYLSWASWLATVFAVALPSALGVIALSFLLGALGVHTGPRLALAATWGLATLALPYSTLYYGHQVCAALMIGAFVLLVRIGRGVDEVARVRLGAVGAMLGWAVVVEYPAALVMVVLGVYAWRMVSWRALVWIALGAAVPALILAAYHTAAFGAPWKLAYSYSTQGARHVGFMGIGVPDWTALQAIIASPFRGILFSTPWLALALPGAWRLWRSGKCAETITCAAIVVLFVWMNASLVDWYGGWGVGPRYLVPCLPFAAVLAGGMLVVPVLRFKKVTLAIAGALVAWSLAFMLAATAVRPEVDDEIEHPFGDYIWPHVRANQVAVSTQGIDMKGIGPPGAPKQAWNWGERIGLAGLGSLVPLAVWAGGWSVLVMRRTRREMKPP